MGKVNDTGKNKCILHFLKIVVLLGFFSIVILHIVFYTVSEVWKFCGNYQHICRVWKNVEFLSKFCGVNIVESVSSFVSVEKLWKFCGTN